MIRQLSVFVENKPGSFRQVTNALHKKEIRIYGYCSVDSPEFGILRVVTDRVSESERLLTEAGFMVKGYDVIAVKLTQEAEMDELLAACYEGNVNINYMYSSAGTEQGDFVVVLHCEYLEETESMLQAKGFLCLNSMEA